jgi:lactate racemase
MSSFEFKYGDSRISGYFSNERTFEVLKKEVETQEVDECEVIINALDNPIGTSKIEDIVKPESTICIVVSDITRAYQKMSFYLPYIVDRLNKSGIKDKDITFLCATGSHRKQTQDEHNEILGDLAKRFTIVDHDCNDKSNLVYLGETSYGTPVSINKIALQSDYVILTGAVVFHDLAGWAGGKKSLVPGIAGYETIMGNHSLSLSVNQGEGVNPLVRCGNKADNPVHLDMLEAAKKVNPSFMFNVIINEDGKIINAVAGDFIKAHEVGCKIIDETDRLYIKEKAEIVIVSAGGYPKDIDLYQASKALINAKEAAKEGGTIILISECREGVGSSEVSVIIQNYPDNASREEELRRIFSISKYTGYLITSIADKFNVILVSNIDEKIISNSNIKIVRELNEALKIAYKDKEKCIKTYVVPNGSSILPTTINE